MPRHALGMPSGLVPVPYYSHAVRAGDFIFVSGQGPRDPRNGEFSGDTIEEQTALTLDCVSGNILIEIDVIAYTGPA